MQKFWKLSAVTGIVTVGAILRFGFLNWGYPYFFHPDENNVMYAIGKLSFTQWNPHFFAYGGLPIYTAFLISSIVSFGDKNFLAIAYTLRFFSALLSFLIIPSLFIIGKKMFSPFVGYTAAGLSIFSVGLIQYAHFGTFEMWLTFFTLWLFNSCFLLYQNPSKKHVILVSFLMGVLLSIKVSSVFFLILPPLILFFRRKKIQFTPNIFLYSLIVVCVYLATNPFLIFDTNSFIGSLSYESSVAIGTFPVFYTQSFLQTTPIVFQLLRIFPFLLNPFVFLFFLVSLFVLLTKIKQWKSTHLLLVIFLLITFFSQAFLFVKWTRYMIPTLPFIFLCISLFISEAHKKIRISLAAILIAISSFYATIFFLTVYPHDSRLEAAIFMQKELPQQKAIFEPYDLGVLPFNSLMRGSIVNLYDLETDPLVQQELKDELSRSTFFVSPSQRLLRSRLTDPKDFPHGHAFYVGLTNGSLGYKIIYQTPCAIWCKILYSGNPIQSVEETTTTFDRPIVTIFKKSM